MWVQKSFGILLIVASAGLTVAGGVAVYYGYGPGGLPRCDSRAARDTVNEMIARSPMGRVMAVSIRSLDDVATVSTAAGRIVCTANATLSDNTARRLGYQFWNQGPEMMVEYRFDP